MSQLRIAQLTATYPPYWGGTGTAAYEHGAELARRGHHVEVFTGTPGTPADDAPGVTVHRIDPVFAIGNAPLIPQLARLRGFDVIHLQHPFIFGADLTLLGRLRRGRAPLVVTYQNRLIGEGARRPLFWAYEETVGRTLARVADRNLVLSAAHADSVSYLRAGRRKRPRQFAEVPNGVDVERFAPGPDEGVRERHGIPAGATLAVFVAALDRAHHFKRFDLLLAALAHPAAADVHALAVGGGELLEPFRAETARAGLGDRVHFTGPQPNSALPGILRAADLLVLPSDPPESFGIVLVEAMACGVPAVVSDIPGPSGVVEDGRTGFVFGRGDAADLAAKIGRIAAMGPEQRRTVGMAGRERCVERYSWASVVDRLEAVYADVVARKRTATNAP